MEEHHPALFCKQNPCLSAIVKLSNILDSHFSCSFSVDYQRALQDYSVSFVMKYESHSEMVDSKSQKWKQLSWADTSC